MNLQRVSVKVNTVEVVVWQLGEFREPRAIRAFAGHDSHY
jgi:hypothetical protein